MSLVLLMGKIDSLIKIEFLLHGLGLVGDFDCSCFAELIFPVAFQILD